jgi:hypothetical protein
LSGVASLQERFRALSARATIGTDRVGGDEASAQTLLDDAARLGIQARAGWRPQIHSSRLPACPPDAQATAPRAALATLVRLLDAGDPGLIEEWAQLARSHAVLVDAATAPLVLDWWARQPRRSETIVAALGRRGEWLASLNAEWQKHVATPDIPGDADKVWQTGKSTERLAILIAVRRHDPARALAFVASSWQDDSASDRQRFLEVLLENRSLADEPALEAALDDRSKLVRRQAAGVLALIPGSRLRQRLSDAARAMISVRIPRGTPIGHKRHQIVLTPPESFAPEWERDGIAQRPPDGIGPRAWWMRQILALSDLTVWTEGTELKPHEVLEALRGDDYFSDAVQALIEAAAAGGDAEWIATLTRWLLRQSPVDLAAVSTLLAGLPDDRREPLALEVATKAPLTSVDRWTVVTSFERPWSSSFSTEAMKAVTEQVSRDPKDAWRLQRAIEAASRRVSPDAVDAFEEAVVRSYEESPGEGAIRSIERARLRADMHKEFTS